ncbi:MAG: alpha/beta fold hydrolase [Desulfobacteraceae bacterium]|nr:alpha/beta fold hydrolase [Desulfobacteraceae bacterium]
MKKLFNSICLCLLVCLLSSNNVFAGDASTKYPVVLAHGMGASAEILGIVDYWWSIDDELEKNGAAVFKTSVNGMDGTIAKAEDFKRQVLDILAATGKEKVNIIGHSHGTLYSRYAISNLGLGPYVASYTSIAGPHRGSSIADMVIDTLPDSLHDDVGGAFDFIYTWVFGDTNPDSLQNAIDLTTDYMKNVFNPNTPDIDGIYYQSYAAKAKWSCPSLILQPTWLIMLVKEGANDGLVGVESAKWGNFKGVKSGAWYSAGVDHLNIVDQMFGITPGFDAPAFYVGIVSDLKNRGF